MNQVKILIASAIILAFATATAHAEWRLGMQLGFGSSELEAKGDLTDGSEKDSGGSFDVFSQWRTANTNAVSYGIHLGYGQDNSEYKDSVSGTIDLQNFGIGNAPDVGDVTLDLEAEQGNTFNLLGLVAWNGNRLTPYIMLGYTSVELDAEGTIIGSGFTDTTFNATVTAKDDTTLKGYKLVGGVEGAFAKNWVWHAAIQYVDYGDETIKFTAEGITTKDKVELDSTSIHFGIAYRF